MIVQFVPTSTRDPIGLAQRLDCAVFHVLRSEGLLACETWFFRRHLCIPLHACLTLCPPRDTQSVHIPQYLHTSALFRTV